MSSRLPFHSAVATGRGDDGTTGLLFGGPRVRKDGLRTEAFGTIDESVAALGMARAELAIAADGGDGAAAVLAALILRFQRELFVAGAELATTPEARDRQVDGQTRVSQAMLDGVETVLRDTEAAIELPREFIVPGETRASAAIELARAVLRRAERRAVALSDEDEVVRGSLVLPYLNRLADLLWILARQAEQTEDRTSTTVRTERRSRPSTAHQTESVPSKGSEP